VTIPALLTLPAPSCVDLPHLTRTQPTPTTSNGPRSTFLLVSNVCPAQNRSRGPTALPFLALLCETTLLPPLILLTPTPAPAPALLAPPHPSLLLFRTPAPLPTTHTLLPTSPPSLYLQTPASLPHPRTFLPPPPNPHTAAPHSLLPISAAILPLRLLAAHLFIL